ncbi:MAG: DUF6651 domain-containing protein [Acidobacteriaceae bacterium]
MKLKIDDKGAVVVQDDKPVYVDDAGRDVVFDYPATLATIARLNSEAKGHREEKEAAQALLKNFEGIEDPAKAIKALEIVKNLDDKKLIEAGEVDKVRQEAQAAYEEKLKSVEKKYAPVIKERDEYKDSLFKEIVGGAFGRSKFIGEKLAIPADLAQAKFGNSFIIEDGKVVGKNAAGERIFSRSRPGEVANFDEALEVLVDDYPYRDSILKGSGASGSGAGNSVRNVGGKKTITRAAFDVLDPATKAATVKDTVIVD